MTAAGYAGHLQTAVERAQDPELLARELSRATSVIIPTTGASATTPAAAAAPAPPLTGDQIKALLSKVGTTDSLALKNCIWAALGKFGMQGDATVADWKPDASVDDLNKTIEALREANDTLRAQLTTQQPASPAAASAAASAAGPGFKYTVGQLGMQGVWAEPAEGEGDDKTDWHDCSVKDREYSRLYDTNFYSVSFSNEKKVLSENELQSIEEYTGTRKRKRAAAAAAPPAARR